jgi:hypothetical protein
LCYLPLGADQDTLLALTKGEKMGDAGIVSDRGSVGYVTGRDALLKRLALFSCVLVFTVCCGCGGKDTGTRPEDQPPTINGVLLEPRRAAPGDTVTATAIAGDPEGDPLTFLWRASRGVLLDSVSSSATWVAPNFAATCSLVVIVRDEANQTSLTTMIPVGVGTLTIESYPQGAAVFIDFEPTVYVTPVTIDPAPAGAYSIGVQRSPFAYTPTSKSVEVTNGNAAQAVFGLNGAMMSLIQLEDPVNECVSQSSWSPNGAQVACAVENDVAHYQKIEIFEEPWPDNFGDYLETTAQPDWSPSWGVGDQMLFASSRTGLNQVYRVPVTGGIPLPVYSGEANYPAWSWDGTDMAFVARDGAGFSLIARPSTVPTPVTLVTDVVEDRPTWKPDGTQIAFSKLVDGQPYIFTVPSSGGTAQQISHVPGTHPQWSADGNRIAFVSSFGGSSGVWVLFLDKGPEPLDGWLTTGDEDWPTWRPVSGELCFTVASPSADCRTLWAAQNFPF